MLRIPSRTTTARVRVIADSGWEDSVPARWTAQLVVGGLPGILVCLVIMWMVGKPSGEGSGARAHIASMVPLLSASGLADSPAFHRLQPGANASALHAPQFRTPEGPSSQERPGGAVQAAPSAAVDFTTPRIAWAHLNAGVRASIDAGLAKSRDWRRIVLHGSGAGHGNARLLDRYHAAVRGQDQVYHFVIGNGSGAADGLIEAGRRWASAPAEDKDIEVCLVGDFNERAPSKAQMEALHELMDYLSIKLGKVELVAHQTGQGTAGCLGTKLVLADGGR